MSARRFDSWSQRLFLKWCCIVLALCATFAQTSQAQYNANVNFNTNYQTFEGWGTSLAWWANVVGGYPDTGTGNRQDYINRVFDPSTGLGLNIVRYNIGGGENPQYLAPNTQYLQYRANMPGFLASSTAQYDWTKDANQRWVLQQSMLKGVTIAEAFSNSPPWWMTNSGSVTGAMNGGNNLNPSFENAFADYLTTVVQHYHDAWGITFRTLEPFNEPASNWWKFGGVSGGSTQEGCGFDAGTQNAVAAIVGASLASKNMSYTTLSTSDENSIDQAVTTFAAMGNSSLASMSQINTHSYNGSARSTLMGDVAAANKRLWMSEYGDGDATGITMAQQILTDLKGMQPKSWIYWQAVEGLNNDGTPSGWGLMNTKGLAGATNYGYTFNEKYYVMENFSKFIRPGYQFIGMDDNNSVAAYDGNGNLVIVTVNSSSNAQTVTYNLQNMPASMGAGPWNVQAYRTSATENLAAQPPFYVTGTNFYYTVPAGSVTTFALNGVNIDSQVATNSPAIVDGGQYVVYTQWNYPSDSNVQVLQETNRVNGQAQAAPGVQLVTDGNWCNNVLGCASIDHARVWVAHAAGNGKWVFTNLHSEDLGTPLAMDIAGTTDKSAVVQNARTDGPTQQWTVQPTSNGSGSYRISPATSNLTLHMDQNNGWWGGGVYLCTEADASCGDNWSDRYEWHLIPFQGAAMSTALAVSYPANPTTATSMKLTAKIATNGGATATGTVTFYDGSTQLGQANLSATGNTATYTAGAMTKGTHLISAVYSGDSSNLTSATQAQVYISPLMPSTTTLSTSATSLAVGQNVTFTATLATTSGATPTGTVLFSAGSKTLATVPVTSNVVTYSVNNLAVGAYSVTATYSGDSINGTSASSATLVTVNAAGPAASHASLTSSPAAPIVGNTVTLSATVSGSGGSPTGNVYFVDGSNVLGNASIGSGGVATLTTSALAVGTHTLSAYYPGDANFASTTSAANTLQVYAVPVGDYVLSSSVNTLDLNAGTQKAVITVATSGGYNQPINFSCSGLPDGYTCAFSPATLTPGSNLVSTQLVITPSAASQLAAFKYRRGIFAALGGTSLCLLFFPFSSSLRKRTRGMLMMLATLGVLGFSMMGCSATHTKSYSVVITGTSLPVTHTVTITAQK